LVLEELCSRRPGNNACWNAWAKAAASVGVSGGSRRWLSRAAGFESDGDGGGGGGGDDERKNGARSPAALPPLVLLGASRACSGDARSGARDLAAARRLAPSEPLPALCLSVALASAAIAPSPRSPPPDLEEAALAHACSYASLRGKAHLQESLYNQGRVLHGLGLSVAASGLYARALLLENEQREKESAATTTKATTTAAAAKTPPFAKVTHEAAHNLSLILKASDDQRAARAVLRKYATV
jgi:hypothetical protein